MKVSDNDDSAPSGIADSSTELGLRPDGADCLSDIATRHLML